MRIKDNRPHGTVDGIRVCGPTRELARVHAWPQPIGQCIYCMEQERKKPRSSAKRLARLLRDAADRLDPTVNGEPT